MHMRLVRSTDDTKSRRGLGTDTSAAACAIVGALIVLLRIAAALALLTATPLLAESFSGKVVSVTDGDTIRVMRDGVAERVRLWGIDAPEARQAFANRAKQFTSSFAFGNTVSVEIKGIDRYKRIVGVVTLPDGKILNHEIVRAGFAWWYRQYAKNDPVLAELEDGARVGKRGLWVEPQPVPPWEFRKNE
jgi:micrococcal nuclease